MAAYKKNTGSAPKMPKMKKPKVKLSVAKGSFAAAAAGRSGKTPPAYGRRRKSVGTGPVPAPRSGFGGDQGSSGGRTPTVTGPRKGTGSASSSRPRAGSKAQSVIREMRGIGVPGTDAAPSYRTGAPRRVVGVVKPTQPSPTTRPKRQQSVSPGNSAAGRNHLSVQGSASTTNAPHPASGKTIQAPRRGPQSLPPQAKAYGARRRIGSAG